MLLIDFFISSVFFVLGAKDVLIFSKYTLHFIECDKNIVLD